MALTRIVGDIHGKIYDYRSYTLVTEIRGKHIVGPERSIQVGDFGIGFFSPFWHEKEIEWQKENPQHRFIRGNHDDPEMCKNMPGYIEDGTVEGDVMFVGGAWSIDFAWRTPMVDWWPGEELSVEELDKLITKFGQTKPRIMITHDCPTQIAWDMFVSRGNSFGTQHIKTRTGEALQAMWEIHQPEHWIFGHWHNTRDLTLHGTKFQCLGELDFIDIDI
jgi:Icc-related predicted phosphoesterase